MRQRSSVLALALVAAAFAAGSCVVPGAAAQPAPCPDRVAWTCESGAVVRGSRATKTLALVFTGHEFAEAAPTILRTLAERRLDAAFFLTGDFVRRYRPLVRRMHRAGHLVGPHSDRHLLYASWEAPPRRLVTRDSAVRDLRANVREIVRSGLPRPRHVLPPYEHVTPEIAGWLAAEGLTVVNLTRGTRSQTDYMEDRDPAFVPADSIVASILRAERRDPNGLGGYLLLMHVGAGPGRTRDSLAPRLGALLDTLAGRGYRFVRLDRLLPLRR